MAKLATGELAFAYGDLYPGWGGVETSNLATPEVSDQVALNEDIDVAEQSTNTEAKRKNIFIALAVILGVIIFFGGR